MTVTNSGDSHDECPTSGLVVIIVAVVKMSTWRTISDHVRVGNDAQELSVLQRTVDL